MNTEDAIQRIGAAITPVTRGSVDAAGVHVESLTEAVMGVTAGLVKIAGAINNLADVLRPKITNSPWNKDED